MSDKKRNRQDFVAGIIILSVAGIGCGEMIASRNLIAAFFLLTGIILAASGLKFNRDTAVSIAKIELCDEVSGWVKPRKPNAG